MNITELKDYTAVTGGVLGALAFFWRVWDVNISHLEIDLNFEHEEYPKGSGSHTPIAGISIKNPGISAKKISYAVLIVGPSSKPLNSILTNLCAIKSETIVKRPLIELFKRRSNVSWQCSEKESHAIPLPFFYLDNQQVGNELIKFKRPLEIPNLAPGTQCRAYLLVYSIHLYALTRIRLTSNIFRTAYIANTTRS